MSQRSETAVWKGTETLNSGGRRWRKYLVRGALASGVVFLLLLAFVAIQLAPLLLERNNYANVVSIERDSAYQDENLLLEAWRQPVAAQYAGLPFEYQHNASFCGPTSAADVLHSLGQARSQDQMLASSPYHAWFGYLLGGLTLDQEADLLSKQTARPVVVLRNLTIEQFREQMRAVNDTHKRYVVNFHRGPMFGRGHGHFSPLLGYLAERDLVLVGDVNPSYRPYLAPTERLWRATRTIDDATGKERGLAVISVD